jgi:hypothetical protein
LYREINCIFLHMCLQYFLVILIPSIFLPYTPPPFLEQLQRFLIILFFTHEYKIDPAYSPSLTLSLCPSRLSGTNPQKRPVLPSCSSFFLSVYWWSKRVHKTFYKKDYHCIFISSTLLFSKQISKQKMHTDFGTWNKK